MLPATEACCICLTETLSLDSAALVVRCESGHLTCATCLEQHVRFSCNLSDPAAQQQLLNGDGATVIACPFSDISGRASLACLERFRLSQIAAVVSPAVLDNVAVPAMVWVASCSGGAIAAEQIAKRSEQEERKKKRAADIANQTMLRAALPDAYQCGRCGHGPVLHSNCNNLSAHHGEVLRVGGARLRRSNACAKCGWFAADISSWPRWDGSFTDDNTEMNNGKHCPGLLSVLLKSLWRNSWRIETFINYGIGMALGIFLSSRVFGWTCSMLSWIWWLLCLVPNCAWRWTCASVSWMFSIVTGGCACVAIVLLTIIQGLYTSVVFIYNIKEVVFVCIGILTLFWWYSSRPRQRTSWEERIRRQKQKEKRERQDRRLHPQRDGATRMDREAQHHQKNRSDKEAFSNRNHVKFASPLTRKRRIGFR